MRATGDPGALCFFCFLFDVSCGDSGRLRFRLNSASSVSFVLDLLFPFRFEPSSVKTASGEVERPPASEGGLDVFTVLPRAAPLRVVARPMHELR